MILKDFINTYSSCPLCAGSLIPYIRSEDGRPPGAKLKYFRDINSKLTGKSFVIKIDYTTFTRELHDSISVNIENNLITCTQRASDVSSVFNSLSLRLEKVCDCDQYYLLSKYLISNSGLFVQPVELDTEVILISNDLTAVSYNSIQKTIIYNSDNIKVPPITLPIIKFSPQEKEKQFNRIHTIVNFS